MARRQTRGKTPRHTKSPGPGGGRNGAQASTGRSRTAGSGAGRHRTRTPANPKSSFERYIALAQAAAQSGDSVAAENYYQHADHYYRVMNEATP